MTIETVTSVTMALLLLAAVGAVVTLAAAVIIDERRYRRDRAAIEHAEAMDALARAAAPDPKPDALTQAYRDHIDHTIGRHAIDALDGLEADGLDPETDGPALARAIAAAVGQPLE